MANVFVPVQSTPGRESGWVNVDHIERLVQATHEGLPYVRIFMVSGESWWWEGRVGEFIRENVYEPEPIHG